MQNKVLNFGAEKPGIEVNIGTEKFFFATDDESLVLFDEKQSDVQKQVEALRKANEGKEEENSREQLENAKEIIRLPFEAYFGEGSFERFYKMVPSIIRAAQMFNEVENALADELEKISARRSQVSKQEQQALLAKKAKKAIK